MISLSSYLLLAGLVLPISIPKATNNKHIVPDSKICITYILNRFLKNTFLEALFVIDPCVVQIECLVEYFPLKAGTLLIMLQNLRELDIKL